MAYTPNIWVDREGTTRYFETVEKDGAKIFTPDYSQLTEIGTPVNADNMNHIEEGIAAGSFTKYDSNTVYQINDLVTSFEGSELKVYKSLKSENYNNPVTDATYWEEVALGGGGSGFNLFDTKISDHILEGDEALGWALQGTYVYKEGVAGSRTGYADFYSKCLEEKENSTATETTLGDNAITMYVNANGHKFYDIADKTVIDNWYNTYGIADYYGIDLVNERIFLPRNDYFVQLTTDTSKVNDAIEAGLPDINSNIFFRKYENGVGAVYSADGASVLNNDSISQNTPYAYTRATTTYNLQQVSIDASRSSEVYGNSDTVQPPSSLKLLYYCVGNTKIESAISNVTEITTSENDTLPLFYNFYSKEDMTTTGAYVNASLGSWLSGNVYATAYNELVNKLGTDNVKANTDTYTDYDFVVNQDDMTFRLPLLNGDENVPDYENNLGWNVGNNYTAPSDGIYWFSVPNSNTARYIYINGVEFGAVYNSYGTGGGYQVPLSKGDTIIVTSADTSLNSSYFIPYKGNGNLYYKVTNAVTNLELLDVAKVTADLNTCYKRNAGDNSDLSGLAMPSDRYIDLVVGASDAKYTAPANGYFQVCGVGITNNVASALGLYLANNNENFTNSPRSARDTGWGVQFMCATLPVTKGDIVGVNWADITYSYSGYNNLGLKFIYAEGEV